MMENAKILHTETVSKKSHFPLQSITFSHPDKQGVWKEKKHEIYQMGNAATVLLYNKDLKTVILTRQFRLPAFLNKENGLLIEACAGKLDKENEHAEAGILREIEEETGYRVPQVQKIFEAYMSPGYVTEVIHFFVAEYNASMKVTEGGGLQEEEEEIEVMELPFTEAINLLNSGAIKDAKTIMLLQYAQLHQLASA